MKTVGCAFEPEALAAALDRRWPEGVDETLHAHVQSCRDCSEVVTVATALQQARETGGAPPALPDAGRAWRMAQLRARREATQTAGRPITAAQVIALACAAGLLGACFGATSESFQAALRAPLLVSAAELLSQHALLFLGAGAILVTIPAAVYLAILRD